MFSPVNQAFSLWLLLFSSSLFFFHKFVFYPSPLSLSFSLFLSVYLPPPPVGVKGFWQAVHVTPDISHGEQRWWMGVKDGGMWRFMWTRQRKLLQGQSHLVLRWPPGTLCVCVYCVFRHWPVICCIIPLGGASLLQLWQRFVAGCRFPFFTFDDDSVRTIDGTWSCEPVSFFPFFLACKTQVFHHYVAQSLTDLIWEKPNW